MRVGNESRRKNDDDKKKKKDKSILEAEIMAIMQKSLKEALDAAIDDLLRGFQ